jgi:folate-binding protein YgfZ
MGGIDNQYRIIVSKAGWHERRSRGRVRIDGADRVSFLQALVTNDLQGLRRDLGVYAAYLTPQGRLITDMRIYDRGDSLLLDVPAAVTATLVARLDGLVFSEDVRLSDVTGSVGAISVLGAPAPRLLAAALGADASVMESLPPNGCVEQPAGLVVRSDEVPDPALPMFDLYMPAEAQGDTVSRLETTGIESIGGEIVDALRIEAGRPVFGRDMDEHTIPLEAGLLDRAISLTKGCYVGQEVIVRVLHRGGGRVARRLVKLTFDPSLDTPPEPGTPLRIGAADSGKITSSARSPRLERVIALGYLPREAAEAGGTVTALVGGIERTAEISGLAG